MVAATLFSGIGAPEQAMPSWDWRWHAEIEPFPSAVLAARHAQSVNLGDVSADDFVARAAALGRPDILVFGSPCQSFSVAGKRLGLDDARGNLALVALGIVAKLRPTWFVFENVPGLLSSADGRDFGLFLRTVDDIGYHVCWRVLDAQFAGVAQRRRRVFAVGHARDWRRAAAVLLEPDRLCGHPPARGEARQDVAGTISPGAHPGGYSGQDASQGLLVAGTLGRDHGNVRADHAWTGRLIPQAFGGNNTIGPVDVATACNAHGGPHGRLDFGSETFIATFDPTQVTSKANRSTSRPGLCHTLPANGYPPVAFSAKDHGADASVDISPTLRSGGHHESHANGGVMPAVAFDARQSDVIQYGEKTGPLDTDGHTMGILTSGVRRLTPRECERLQGFPDDYTAITYRGKPAADGPRYKAIGNSMAVPVIGWILSRIEALERLVPDEVAS